MLTCWREKRGNMERKEEKKKTQNPQAKSKTPKRKKNK
jgi:hypothetical protein